MEYTNILFAVRDSVGQITLNRPEAKNALNLDMAKELMRAAIQCSEDPAIRAVMITGSSDAFCVGGDIKLFAAQGKNLPRLLKEMTTYLHAAVSFLTRMEVPTVVAVNGLAAGAGMSLALAADIAVAAESARFTMAYTRMGLTPDGGSTYFLSRIVGLKQALDLVLTNRQLSAQEALDLGIVTRVVPDADLLPQAEAIATHLAGGATKALGVSKRLLHSGWTETLETQMEHESWAIAAMARTSDANAAIAAFIKKGTPKFKGQ